MKSLLCVPRSVALFAIVALISSTAFADAPAAGKNISNSPRETIVNYPGNIQYHAFIRNDGSYGVVKHDYNKGVVEHYVIDPRTGLVRPGPVPSGK
jgi:hypothetical protein